MLYGVWVDVNQLNILDQGQQRCYHARELQSMDFTQTKSLQVERKRHQISPRGQMQGVSIADQKHDLAMNEVTQSVNNIALGAQIQAGRSVAMCAEKVRQKALSYENDGDRAAAIKLVQEAIDDGVQPVLQLQQFQVDLVRRKHVAANLKRDAVRRAIIGPCAKTEELFTHQVENAGHVITPGVVVASALSFNSMHDHGTAGGSAPNSVATVGSKTPVSLSTPSLPPGAISSPFDSPLGSNEEEKHEAIGVRMMSNVPAISPVLEPISCGADDVDLLLSGADDHPSSCNDRPSPRACDSGTEFARDVTARSCQKGGGGGGPRSSYRSSTSTGVGFSLDPPVLIEADAEASAGVNDPPTPKGRARRSLKMDAGHTPWTPSEKFEEHHVTLVEQPTACYPAQQDESAVADEPSWASRPVLSKRLSINAGRTPRRPSNALVSFAPAGDAGTTPDADEASAASAASEAVFGSERSMSACVEDVPAPQRMRRSLNAGSTPKHCHMTFVQFADSPGKLRGLDESVGTEEWAQAVSAASTPTAHSPAPPAEFGDVDMTPDLSGGEGSGADGDEPEVWIVSDEMAPVPKCSKAEKVRRSMNAGHTPAPSRTASLMGEASDSGDDGGDAGGQSATAPLAPVAAEGGGVLAPEAEVPDAAARLDFNTHGAMRVGAAAGGHGRRVSFAANTADAAGRGNRPSVGHVITPHVLQKPARPGLGPTLEMPSTQSVAATGQRASMRGPLAGSLFSTPVSEHTPSLGADEVGAASTVGGGAVPPGTHRKPTPATGAVHVPCEGDARRGVVSSTEFDDSADAEAADHASVATDGPLGGALFVSPAVGASDHDDDSTLQIGQTPGCLDDDGTMQHEEEDPEEAGAGAQQPSAQQETVLEGPSGRDSVGELLLPDYTVAAAASPGCSSISFESPPRSVWGGFGTPGSEASTPSMSLRGGVSVKSGKQPRSRSHTVDLAPPAGFPAGSPLYQQASDAPAFVTSGGFMPMLTDDTSVAEAQHLAAPESTPPPAVNDGGDPGLATAPDTGSASDTDGLLDDDVPSPETAVPGVLAATEGQEVQEEDAEGGTGGVEEQAREALEALSVSGSSSAAGALSDGVSREVKALMADSVASKVAASSAEMGTHEVLVPVKAAPGQRSVHGTPKVLTPVRRSRRSTAALTPPPDISEQLAGTQWAYAPNMALRQPDLQQDEDDDGL